MAGGRVRVPCKGMRSDGREMELGKDPRCKTSQMVVGVDKRGDRYRTAFLAALGQEAEAWHRSRTRHTGDK